MNHDIFIPTEKKFRQILEDTVESILDQRIPKIIRRANRKEVLTTSELKELTGMSFRMQKYHRDQGNLPFSKSGRKIFYRTEDVEKFMEERRIEAV
jgi:hypothetical protein